jgi:hypothetical protein
VRHGGHQLTSMFPATSYDPETLNMLIRVFDEAWAAMRAELVNRHRPFDANALRSALAKRIIVAADKGERDPARLKLIALQMV